ncbi:MAG TPA: hypothetical protein VIY10_16555 [Solirubrobacteraceae bacterium]|jgi:hypothetical protein
MADTPTSPDGGGSAVPKIAGLSALKGLVVYAAVLSFAGLYGYFIVKISTASGQPPALPSVLVSAAAALAGVLGSAFALEVGVTTPPSATNSRLNRKLAAQGKRIHLRIRQLLSLEPINISAASWPKTVGIWLYAIVGAAVAVTYALNPSQTPSTIKALAVAFAGYILALVTAAYHDDGGPAVPAVPADPADADAPGADAPPAPASEQQPDANGNGNGSPAAAKEALNEAAHK